jgi:hypothetical protein
VDQSQLGLLLELSLVGVFLVRRVMEDGLEVLVDLLALLRVKPSLLVSDVKVLGSKGMLAQNLQNRDLHPSSKLLVHSLREVSE